MYIIIYVIYHIIFILHNYTLYINIIYYALLIYNYIICYILYNIFILYIIFIWYNYVLYIILFWFYSLKYIYIYREREREEERERLIYYEKLAHMIMEAAIGQLERQDWVWWRAEAVVPGQKLAGLRPMKSMFQFEPEGRKYLMSQLKAAKQEEFPLIWGRVSLQFYSGLQLIAWGPPRLGRAIWFTQSINLNVNLRTSLAVQWLRPCAPNAGGMDLIPCRGTRIPHAAWWGLKKNK